MGKILSIVGAVLFLGIMFYPVGGGFSMFTAVSFLISSAGAAIVVAASAGSLALAFVAGKEKISGLLGIIPVLLIVSIIAMSGGRGFDIMGILWLLGAILQVAGGFIAAKASAGEA